MSSARKPLGGIATLTLGAASLDGAAPALLESGTQIPLLEDRSSYCEETQWIGSSKSVKHTLTFCTAAEYELPQPLLAALSNGYVAQVDFNSGEQIIVGYSATAAADRALRLVSCTMSSGQKPSQRGCKVFVLESMDGEQKI